MKKSTFIALITLLIIFGGLLYIAYTNKETPAPNITTKSSTYTCKDKKIINVMFHTATFNDPQTSKNSEPTLTTESADLTLSDGRNLHLSQTVSASGAKYTNNDESFIFWTKGTSAIILENNKEGAYLDCIEQGVPQI